MMISASSRACVLNGETTTWTNRLRTRSCPSAYLILFLMPAWMEYSVRTAAWNRMATPACMCCRGTRAGRPLLDRHALGEIARLVDVCAFGQRCVVGKKLKRHGV